MSGSSNETAELPKDQEIFDSHSSGYDCHSVVKSSGLTAKKRLCCEHGHKCFKSMKINVACQTDPDENDLDFKAEQFERNQTDDSASTNASFEQQTVAQDLCHAKDEDGSKPEGVLRLMIHNFRNMNDTVRGPAKLVTGVPWKIMVMPRQHVVAKKGTQKCLGFFLQCCPESYSDSWSCQASAELRLISQKHGVPNFVRKTNHVYTAKENDWGYSCFMTWADILDESQGYMKEESVILEVFVKAESPKGILSYEAFCKKIQDYMRLSDMQCSRNLIDKALEVNQTALKFCKDKDVVMKEELEKQKTRLIERKLMQSIERIEKDSKVIDNFESGTNLSNLRQALAGNLAAFKNASTGTTAGQTTGAAKPPTANAGNVVAPPTALSQQLKDAATNKQTTKSANKAKNEEQTQPLDKLRDKKDKEEAKRRCEVKNIVENLVSNLDGSKNLSGEKLLAARHRSSGGPGALVDLFDLDEPCCSDQSDDDDDDDESDYEDIDEVCDGCLVEKLDNLSGVSSVLVDAQDMSCQTDFQPLRTTAPQTKIRATPVGAVAPPPSPLPASKNETAQKVSPPSFKTLKQKFIAEHQQSINRASAAAKVAAVALAQDDNDELLKLITKESKASLSTIKDTLERLLCQENAAGGGNPTDGSAPLVPLPLDIAAVAPPFPFDLRSAATLPTPTAKRSPLSGASSVQTDVVDIAPSGEGANKKELGVAAVATTPAPAVIATTTSNATTPANALVTTNAQQQVQQTNPVAQSVIKKTLQQQQQLLDVNQQMVQIKQIVEFKRQQQQQHQQNYRELQQAYQQQQALLDDEQLQQQRQHQQFVQTDLSYVPRAPSPITEEDYTLLRHAKEIVENRAEEFSRYSQIIEKSEYDRLAETVKKVEKRMRDIEKQTMTCRKQLADENERNYKEEQKLIKANKQLKQQLDQANEKVEKLNVQLRERRTEIKKMEKKLKVECQTSAENAELNSRIEQLERDLNNARQKHGEEKQKLAEENQKLTEIRKNLQQELSCATNEIERLHAQLEEKSNVLRKNEAAYKQERHQAQVSLKEASDRAKKAEINLLEFKLEIFTKTLQRSYDDCKNHIGQLEELTKRVTREQPVEDFKWLHNYVQDWQKVKEKIHDALQKMKNDFSHQFDAVKSGKSLTSLPVLDLPKAIPFPQAPKQFHALIHEPKQPIAPIGVHPTSAVGATAAQQHKAARSFSPAPTGGHSMVNGVAGAAAAPSIGNFGRTAAPGGLPPASAVATAPLFGPAAPSIGGVDVGRSSIDNCAMHQQQPISDQYSGGGSAAILHSTNNGAGASGGANNGGNIGAQSSANSINTQFGAGGGAPMGGPTYAMTNQQQRNDFTPWSDPLQGLTQSLFGNKPLTNMFDNFGPSYPPMGQPLPGLSSHQSKLSSGPPLPNSLMAAPGQWAWPGGAATSFNAPPPPSMYRSASQQPDGNGQPPPSPAVVVDQSAAVDGRSTSRQQLHQAPDGHSPQPTMESTMDSPITSDKSKQIDTVADQLRSVFPHLSGDMICDCMHEFRSMQYNRTLKGLTGEQLFNGVINVIYSRHKQPAATWSMAPPLGYQMGAPPEMVPPNALNMAQFSVPPPYDQVCTLCGHMARAVDVYTLNCSHSFHTNCITSWLTKKPSCPVCCVYTVPPEEFPDLA